MWSHTPLIKVRQAVRRAHLVHHGLQVPDREPVSRPCRLPSSFSGTLNAVCCSIAVCNNACATAYLPVFTNCHSILEAVAQQQAGARAGKVLRQFDQLGAACTEAQANEATIDTGNVRISGATYFVTNP